MRKSRARAGKCRTAFKLFLFPRANGAEVTSPGQRPGLPFLAMVRPEGAEVFFRYDNERTQSHT